jgi:hypothetical protein
MWKKLGDKEESSQIINLQVGFRKLQRSRLRFVLAMRSM